MNHNEVIDEKIKILKDKRDIISAEITSLYIEKNDKQTVILSSLGNSIIEMVSSMFGVGTSEIKSRGSSKEVAVAKKMVIHLFRKYCGYTYDKIGKMVGGVTHGTVLHSHRGAKELLKHNYDFKGKAAILENQIESAINAIGKNDQ